MATWNFLPEIGRLEASPASFLGRKTALNADTSDGVQSTSRGAKSPRFAEALRRRKMMRGSVDHGGNVQDAASAATSGQIDDKLAPILESMEKASTIFQLVEEMPSMLQSLEEELWGKLSRIERKLDSLGCASQAATKTLSRASSTGLPVPVSKRQSQPRSTARPHRKSVDTLGTRSQTVAPCVSEKLGRHSQRTSLTIDTEDPPAPHAVFKPMPPPGLPVTMVSSGASLRGRRVSVASTLLSSTSLERLFAQVRAIGNNRTPMQRAIWDFVEEPDSSLAAQIFRHCVIVFVMMNVLLCTVQATEPPTLTGHLPVVLHFVCDILFAVEVAVRFAVCPNRCTFFASCANWIDIAAALPLLAQIVQCATDDCRQGELMDSAMVVLPLIRLCKLLRSFEKFHLLLSAFQIAFEALPVLLYSLGILILFFSAAIYFAEPRSNIRTLPEAVWITLTTLTTVGYCDLMPRSTPGLISTAFLIVSGVLYMAIPLGIVGGAFSSVWGDRDRMLLIRRTQIRLEQWGYTAKDILKLFYLYDKDKSGELDLAEFTAMIDEMRLGIGTERVVSLFKTFDTDGSGKVDDEEFVRALYPKAYAEIYSGVSFLDPLDDVHKRVQENIREERDDEGPRLAAAQSETVEGTKVSAGSQSHTTKDTEATMQASQQQKHPNWVYALGSDNTGSGSDYEGPRLDHEVSC
uniref:EF-hand domain-containing protein n=1 Tax=Alexandrium monilatum TaxID=311494 RepID=A0A7S4PTB6_9DINO